MYNKQRIELTVKDIKENKIRGALIKLYESNKTKIKHKKTGVAIYGKRRRGRIEEQHKAVQPLIDRKTVPSKAESKTSGIISTTRRPPKSKLPPEKG